MKETDRHEGRGAYSDNNFTARVLLSEKEVARILKVSPSWLQHRRCQGNGPPFLRIGGTPERGGLIRYDLLMLEDWISNKVFQSTSEYS